MREKRATAVKDRTVKEYDREGKSNLEEGISNGIYDKLTAA
jgi:hypothetical protein